MFAWALTNRASRHDSHTVTNRQASMDLSSRSLLSAKNPIAGPKIATTKDATVIGKKMMMAGPRTSQHTDDCAHEHKPT